MSECITEPEGPNTVEPESVEEVTKSGQAKTDGIETAAESAPDQCNKAAEQHSTEKSKQLGQSDKLDSEPSHIRE